MSLSTESVSYSECEAYILSLSRFAKEKHDLAKIKAFLPYIDYDSQSFKVIHVAGTIGKGSTCAYMASILTRSGIRTGLFTSPHLVSLRERISVDGAAVSGENFVRVFEYLRNRLQAAAFSPTFFEFIFLMALVIFREEKVEYAVMETGLGGRLDATNALENKAVTVITRIGFDHQEILGDTLGQIAHEKAGILRAGAPALALRQDGEIKDSIAAEARRRGASVSFLDASMLKIIEITDKGIDFSCHYRYDENKGHSEPGELCEGVFRVSSKALYQAENAMLAINAAFLLGEPRVSLDTVAAGLGMAVWPGRMEEVLPGVIVDGAHNEDGLRAFLVSVRAFPCFGRCHLLLGFTHEESKRKLGGIIPEGVFDQVVACPMANPRSMSVAELAAMPGVKRVFGDSAAALRYLLENKQENDLVFVCGSLYLVGEIKRLVVKNIEYSEGTSVARRNECSTKERCSTKDECGTEGRVRHGRTSAARKDECGTEGRV